MLISSFFSLVLLCAVLSKTQAGRACTLVGLNAQTDSIKKKKSFVTVEHRESCNPSHYGYGLQPGLCELIRIIGIRIPQAKQKGPEQGESSVDECCTTA